MAQKVTILLLPYFCELVLATFDKRFVYGCWGTSQKNLLLLMRHQQARKK